MHSAQNAATQSRNLYEMHKINTKHNIQVETNRYTKTAFAVSGTFAIAIIMSVVISSAHVMMPEAHAQTNTERLQTITSSTANIETALDAVQDDLDSLLGLMNIFDTLDAISNTISDIPDDIIDAITAQTDQLTGSLTDMASTLDKIYSQVSSLSESQDDLSQKIDAIPDHIQTGVDEIKAGISPNIQNVSMVDYTDEIRGIEQDLSAISATLESIDARLQALEASSRIMQANVSQPQDTNAQTRETPQQATPTNSSSASAALEAGAISWNITYGMAKSGTEGTLGNTPEATRTVTGLLTCDTDVWLRTADATPHKPCLGCSEKGGISQRMVDSYNNTIWDTLYGSAYYDEVVEYDNLRLPAGIFLAYEAYFLERGALAYHPSIGARSNDDTFLTLNVTYVTLHSDTACSFISTEDAPAISSADIKSLVHTMTLSGSQIIRSYDATMTCSLPFRITGMSHAVIGDTWPRFANFASMNITTGNYSNTATINPNGTVTLPSDLPSANTNTSYRIHGLVPGEAMVVSVSYQASDNASCTIREQ